MSRRIAIVGFGAGGCLVALALVPRLSSGDTLVILAPALDAIGVAYGTTNPAHLLNVPARHMSAWSHQPEHFLDWARSAAAALARQQAKITGLPTATDFLPRMFYGAYLQAQWRAAQTEAVARGIRVQWVPSEASALKPGDPLSLLSVRGDAIALDQVILATGQSLRPILPQLPPAMVIQNPWAADALAPALARGGDLLLAGAGLTAVDIVLSLRAAGYGGVIHALSRHGHWPQAHRAPDAPAQPQPIPAIARASALLRAIRDEAQRSGDWRAVVDSLRPDMPARWAALPAPEQQRILRHGMALWNIHRHRMAPAVAARIAAEESAGQLRLHRADLRGLRAQGMQVTLAIPGQASRHFTTVINCTGPSVRVNGEAPAFWRQLLADGVAQAYTTGYGVAADPYGRLWGNLHPRVIAMGPWLSGQRFESTAIPELRQQAAMIAQHLSADAP